MKAEVVMKRKEGSVGRRRSERGRVRVRVGRAVGRAYRVSIESVTLDPASVRAFVRRDV
jgi:hypothetical protein